MRRKARNGRIKPNLKVIPIGGLNEIGKNLTLLEYDDQILIIDCGMSFPESEMYGIDIVIPDFSYLIENQHKLVGMVITHGHEDHIGGIPFLLLVCPIENIYAPAFAKALIEKKLSERRKLANWTIQEINSDSNIKTKHFNVTFYNTVHSIPDSLGVLIETPNGRIVETGDFKFDLTPIGPMADLYKMASLGEEGVDLLIGDSTNALNEGFSKSESIVDETLGDMFTRFKNNRIIIATFASNIYRIKHIFETCYKHNRKICIFGRSMENNISISIEGGYIDHKELLISPEEANNLKPNEVTLLCTGSQGEPLAALSRISNGTHKQIKLRCPELNRAPFLHLL